jgi:hypothetical protein
MVPVEGLPLWAAYWLADGYDGDDLVMLAGFSARDDPRDIRGMLAGALADCGITIPDSDTAAAQVAFTSLARMHAQGQAAERWVLDKVSEIVARSGYAAAVTSLPLGRVFSLDDEWGAGWGRTEQELGAEIRRACAAQLAVSRL